MLRELDFSFRLVPQASERGDLGVVRCGMQFDGRLLHFELLLGEGEIDEALLAINLAFDCLLGRFETRTFDRILRLSELALILLRSDLRLRQGLVERCRCLTELGFFLCELLGGARRIELDQAFTRFDAFAGRRHPGDAEVGDDGGVDLRRTPGLEIAAAADNRQKVALARGRYREVDRGFALRQTVNREGGSANGRQDDE